MAPSPHSDLLRSLPQVEEILNNPSIRSLEPLLARNVLADCVREAIDEVRGAVLAGSCTKVDALAIADSSCAKALANLRPSLRRVINATGVILHTNLGRSVLADEAVHAVEEVARGYSTLEYDTETLSRGSRHDHVERLICAITGAEAAIAVNNNAAAVMMVLVEFASEREAVVSRGELVEIGGSFRIPDIMALSHAGMVEVGTTNKTHASDYARAVHDDTAMLLKVHPSNYRIVGFSESVGIAELRRIADAENARRRCASNGNPTEDVLVYEDQGSGTLLHLDCLGPDAEPTVAESLKAGCDLVSFSGDKLLGGPQAGIVVGSRALIGRLKKNPLARALRLDKMTLAALEATLRLYLDPEQARSSVPTLRMLCEPHEAVRLRAEKLAEAIDCALDPGCAQIETVPETARAGGGSLPLCDIESHAVRIAFSRGSAQGCETFLVSARRVPVVGRIKKEAVLLDARTITEADIPEIASALRAYFDGLEHAQTAALRQPGAEPRSRADRKGGDSR